ncbi:MAG: NUDIX domain-containing protein [Candidatus Berkelbacteria bacterium]|nr:NUDIX domain-containing protein [Candidatus Berkelbacteria bacterium]
MPHIHEKIDFTVEVFIVSGDKVLLRKHDKYKIWLSVGGHIELDEDPNQAAIREVKEEVGLDIDLFGDFKSFNNKNRPDYKELLPPYFMNRHRINESHEHVTMTYLAKSTTDQVTQSVEREKSDECRWFTLRDLSELPDILDSVRHYAITALKVISK